jgi:hypothetical protein
MYLNCDVNTLGVREFCSLPEMSGVQTRSNMGSVIYLNFWCLSILEVKWFCNLPKL